MSALLLLVTGSAAAADETAPVVDVPEDVPGADVIVFYGQTYNFDSSGSTDDTGIVNYTWDFEVNGTPVHLWSTTGKTSYKFVNYTQTWVTVIALDAAGNMGYGYFSIDVVERITSDTTWRDETRVLDHSLYFDDADLTIQNSSVGIPDGVGKGPRGGAGPPDTLAESLTNGGELAGHWEPYNYYWNWQHGDDYYGRPYEDTDTVLSGDASIRVSDGRYLRGFEYHFDSPVDLTGYGALTWYMHSDYPSYNDVNAMYYVYFYGSSDYSSSSGYSRVYVYRQGGASWYKGWHGYTVSLDRTMTGRWYDYRMSDLSSVQVIRFYTYQIRSYYSYSMWIDNVGLYEPTWGDEVTESATPSGGMSGRWSASYGVSTDTSEVFTGSASVRCRLREYRYNDINYYFDSPQDLSSFNALRLFMNMKTDYGSDIRSLDEWRNPQLYVYDDSGEYAYYYGYYYRWCWWWWCWYDYSYIYYGYGSRDGGPWYAQNLAWGPDSAYYDSGVDWTKISHFRLANIRPQYTSTYSYLYIDALEWYAPGGGGGGAGASSDCVPMAIYLQDGDLTVGQNSYVHGTGAIGGRVVDWDGSAQLQQSTFENIWHTEFAGAGNGLHCHGGVEVYGDAVVDNVTFRNCAGPGLALMDGQWTLDPATIDLSGTTQSVNGAPQLIMGVTGHSAGMVSIEVTGWHLENSPSGTGILVMAHDTTAQVDVTIHDNFMSDNAYAGIVISNMGDMAAGPWPASTTADMDVVIKDQYIEGTGMGIMYYGGGGDYDPNTWTNLLVENCTVMGSDEAGLMLWLDMGSTNLDADIVNCTFNENTGDGVMTMYTGFYGMCDITMDNVTCQENEGDGIEVLVDQVPFDDGKGNRISPVASVDIYINNSYIHDNSGWGVVERLNGVDAPEGGSPPPWNANGPTRTTLYYNITCNLSDISKNVAGGWKSKPDGGWMDANLEARHKLLSTYLSENRGPGMYIEPEHDLRGGGAVSDVYWLEDSRINENDRGVEENLASDNFGYYSEVHIYDCRLEDNDRWAVMAYGHTSSDGARTWGTSRVLGAMVFIDGCKFNTPVRLELMGADDSGRDDWDAIMGIQFTNNIVDVEEEDLWYHLGASPDCMDFTAWGDIGKNKFYRGYLTDGVHVEMYGGWNLNMDLTVRDQVISEPEASGIQFIAGTLVPSNEPHQVFGKLTVYNVTIRDTGANGINFSVDHKEAIGAKSRGMLEAHDLSISGVTMGIHATELNGEVYDSTILDTEGPAVFLRYCTFDFFSCDVGPVDVSNIRVLTKGAARMWYDLGVDVKWASGQYVVGATVTVQDNTWETIGVNTVEAAEVLPFGYVNSYTILPDSVYSKSPFRVHGTYLGLETEKMADVDGDKVVQLILVDDILPRLTVNTPMDGEKTRETALTVRGHAWDAHSGLDRVEVSYDGMDWHLATGAPEFSHTFDEVPEGNLLIMVRAIDYAENVNEKIVSVLVDATPPPISIIRPDKVEFSTSEPELEIIGVTEMGATVTVNNVEVPLDHTLFRTTVDLTEGVNVLRIVSTDRLGNWADHELRVTLDTIPPPLVITSPEPDEVVSRKVVDVVGQTEAGAKVKVNGKTVANVNGNIMYRMRLEEGPNVIVVVAEDVVGNMRSVSVPVYLDTQEPWLELSSPVEDDVFGVDGIMVSGWVEEGSSVHVNDLMVDVENGQFSTHVTGQEGRNVIVVTVTDMAGNEAEHQVGVWFDTTPPDIVLASPEDGLMTNVGTVDVSGRLLWDKKREGFRDITLSINGEFAPFAADGTFKVQHQLVEGTNPLFIRASDDVGNTNHVEVSVLMDSTPPFLLAEPTPTFDHPVWNKPATYRSLVYIEGVTEPGVTVLVDGSAVEVDDDTGEFNVSILLDPVPEGEELVMRSVDIEATDPFDNSVDMTIDVYRLEETDEQKGVVTYESAQWWVLVLSIIILVGAIVAAVFLWRRIGMRPEEEYIEDIGYEEEV